MFSSSNKRWSRSVVALLTFFTASFVVVLFQNCGEQIDLNSLNTTASVGGAPVLGSFQAAYSFNVGSTMSISVSATPADVQYQWYFKANGQSNETPLIGQTTATFSKSDAQTSDSGTYRALAYNNQGAVSASIIVSVSGSGVTPTPTVTPPGGSNPSAPTGLTATASGLSVNLSWNQNAAETISAFRVERHLSASSTAPAYTFTVGASVRQISDTGLTNNTTYYYRVYTVNGVYVSTSYASASASVSSGSIANFTAVANSTSAITLSWSFPNRGTNGHTGFRVQQALSVGGSPGTWGPFTSDLDINFTSIQSTGLSAGTTYFYKICAIYSSSTCNFDSPIQATTNGNGNAPSQPQNFSASNITASQISLSWNSAAGATSYRLERWDGDNTVALASFSGLTSLGYTDTSLQGNTAYRYRLYAVAGANSSTAATVSARTLTGTQQPQAVITSQPSPSFIMVTAYCVGTEILFNGGPGGGDSITYTIAGSGSPTLYYGWYHSPPEGGGQFLPYETGTQFRVNFVALNSGMNIFNGKVCASAPCNGSAAGATSQDLQILFLNNTSGQSSNQVYCDGKTDPNPGGI